MDIQESGLPCKRLHNVYSWNNAYIFNNGHFIGKVLLKLE